MIMRDVRIGVLHMIIRDVKIGHFCKLRMRDIKIVQFYSLEYFWNFSERHSYWTVLRVTITDFRIGQFYFLEYFRCFLVVDVLDGI